MTSDNDSTHFQPLPTNPRFKNLTGQRFGRLTVLGFLGNRYWLCICDCGENAKATRNNLVTGNTASCGCLRKETTVARSRTHGRTKSSEFSSWCHMRDRCNNPRCSDFPAYGSRGIKVCERWQTSFQNFLDDMGEKPGPAYTLDRIDNDGNYEPGNVRWALPKTQSNNNRHNRVLTANGRTQTLTQWAEELGTDIRTIRFRLNNGWTVENAVLTPIRHKSDSTRRRT